jgi:glucose/arabinose dehydrogenase
MPVVAVPAGDPRSLTIGLEPIVSGLSNPVGMTNAGDGSGRLFVLEKVGRVRIVSDRQLLSIPFLDISGEVGAEASEQGLLGLAFHPDYATNGFFFVYYTNRQGNTIVARFRVTDDPDIANPSSEERVLYAVQPAGNHNGGNLVFGPDGYLWIGLGDGGRAGDVFGNGQNTQTLLGALLRIDVDQLPYSIPPDNPFANDSVNREEIWAYGLRNPWRFSFDRSNGDLYVADVGQNTYEEVNVVPANAAGLNFGWPIMEGQHCYDTATCDTNGFVLPVAEYDHSLGCSITGGYVYRGAQYPQMKGIYLFGDYCSGIIWGMNQGGGNWRIAQIAPGTGVSLSTFGEAEDGELYLVDMAGGVIYHITAQ